MSFKDYTKRKGHTLWLDVSVLVYLREVPGHWDKLLHRRYPRSWHGLAQTTTGYTYMTFSAAEGDAIHADLLKKHSKQQDIL